MAHQLSDAEAGFIPEAQKEAMDSDDEEELNRQIEEFKLRFKADRNRPKAAAEQTDTDAAKASGLKSFFGKVAASSTKIWIS